MQKIIKVECAEDRDTLNSLLLEGYNVIASNKRLHYFEDDEETIKKIFYEYVIEKTIPLNNKPSFTDLVQQWAKEMKYDAPDYEDYRKGVISFSAWLAIRTKQ